MKDKTNSIRNCAEEIVKSEVLFIWQLSKTYYNIKFDIPSFVHL